MLALMAGTGFQTNQDPTEIHRLVRSAIAQRRPLSAIYKGYDRLMCPHRLGWNREDERRLLSYQYGGESETGLSAPGSKDNWRCMALDQLNHVRVLEGPWHTAENRARPATCIVRVELDVDDQPEGDWQNGQ
jgi:hypothetical protein